MVRPTILVTRSISVMPCQRRGSPLIGRRAAPSRGRRSERPRAGGARRRRRPLRCRRNWSSLSISRSVAASDSELVASSKIEHGECGQTPPGRSRLPAAAPRRGRPRSPSRRSSAPIWSSASRACRRAYAPIDAEPPRGRRPMRMFSATVSVGASVSSWVMATMPSWRARCGVRMPAAAPAISITPSSGSRNPYRHLHQRGLARAVLAHQGVDLSGQQLEVHPVQRAVTPGKRLVMPRILTSGVWVIYSPPIPVVGAIRWSVGGRMVTELPAVARRWRGPGPPGPVLAEGAASASGTRGS